MELSTAERCQAPLAGAVDRCKALSALKAPANLILPVIGKLFVKGYKRQKWKGVLKLNKVAEWYLKNFGT